MYTDKDRSHIDNYQDKLRAAYTAEEDGCEFAAVFEGNDNCKLILCANSCGASLTLTYLWVVMLAKYNIIVF